MLIHKFVLAIFWGPRAGKMRAERPRVEDKGRGPRVEEHKHPISLVNVQTNYCNNNLLILDVKQIKS